MGISGTYLLSTHNNTLNHWYIGILEHWKMGRLGVQLKMLKRHPRAILMMHSLRRAPNVQRYRRLLTCSCLSKVYIISSSLCLFIFSPFHLFIFSSILKHHLSSTSTSTTHCCQTSCTCQYFTYFTNILVLIVNFTPNLGGEEDNFNNSSILSISRLLTFRHIRSIQLRALILSGNVEVSRQ